MRLKLPSVSGEKISTNDEATDGADDRTIGSNMLIESPPICVRTYICRDFNRPRRRKADAIFHQLQWHLHFSDKKTFRDFIKVITHPLSARASSRECLADLGKMDWYRPGLAVSTTVLTAASASAAHWARKPLVTLRFITAGR